MESYFELIDTYIENRCIEKRTGLNRLKSKMRFHCKKYFKPNVNHRVLRSRGGRLQTRNNRPVNDKFFHRATREGHAMKRVKLSEWREHGKIHARLREIRWNYFNQGNELAAAFNCEPRNFVSPLSGMRRSYARKIYYGRI